MNKEGTRDTETYSTRKHLSRRLVVQAKEEYNLADSTGNTTVDFQVAVFESFHNFDRWGFSDGHYIETQDSLHIFVMVGELDQLLDAEGFDYSRARNLVIHTIVIS